MTEVEDRLRAALQARAEQVTAQRPSAPAPARARSVIGPGLRKATLVALAAVLATVLLVLPRLLSQGDPALPADTPPPAGPSSTTSPSPAPSPPGSAPRPVAP
ncbi:hypothetical protein [Streptomyces althioticus]|uniref:hypothetical protein n=1 Tax=Streptomyces althioticus TaxID=83380 RepID=UPI0033E97EE1